MASHAHAQRLAADDEATYGPDFGRPPKAVAPNGAPLPGISARP